MKLLNQYTSRTVPGYVNVLGTATNTATVSLWSPESTALYASTTRKGEYFRGEMPFNNTTGAMWLTITNVAAISNYSTPDIVTNTVGKMLLAKTPETFTYDTDGNLTSDSLWTNGWNGENRRSTIESRTTLPAGAKVKEQWTHLADGRWIERIVSTNNGTSYYPSFTNRYVWDGQVLLAVLDHTNGVVVSFMRGLDLSGSIQGAGGVGGVLAVKAGTSAQCGTMTNTTHFTCYDGNGNVTALVNAADGSESARYEYGAFAERLRETGPMAKLNPIRFSTQYTDDVIGGVKYLFRGLREGRWLSRDPIGEEGGENLYGFVDNDGINFFDLDGLEKGAEALVSMTRNGPSAFGDTPINPLNGLQLLVGLPFSVLSGDIFHSDIQKIPKDTCNVLISVNGILTSRTNANRMLGDLRQNSPRYSGVDFAIAAGNRSTYGGDILQILGDEFGAIQSASFDLARQINQTYEAFKRNGCCCGSIQVFAHSQGTKVFQRAQSLIKPEARKMICYTGIGGETRISPNGLANAENNRNIYDPVPYGQFLNPVNLANQPFIDTNTRDAGGHSYFSSYADWAHQLQPNCPCTSISTK
jgi:RHS repeat-associated protein